MPRLALLTCAKIAAGVAVMCMLSNLYLCLTRGTSHLHTPEDDDEFYFRQLMAQPRPEVLPLPQRKLTHVRIQRRPRHMRLYDIHGQKPPGNRHYDCLQTKTTPSFHVCIYPPDVDRYISRALISDGIWEPYITPLLQKALNKYPDTVFIDVGANIGYYTLLAARIGHQVIAIEPAYENIIRLHKGAALSQVTRNVDVIFTALSDRHENVTLSKSTDNQGGLMVQTLQHQQGSSSSLRSSSLSRSSSTLSNSSSGRRQPEVVMTTTMDHLLEVAEFSQAIIKLDIEGYECKAMAGARRLLTRVYVPYIFMEWNKMYAALHHPDSPCPLGAVNELTRTLVTHGYVPYEVRTGFQLDPGKSTIRWRIGDIYWRHKDAKILQNPY